MRLIDADAAKEKCKEFKKELFEADDVITFLDECCPTVETSSLWISVKDRLPAKAAYYLVSMSSRRLQPTVCFYSKMCGWVVSDIGVTEEWITHWMPFPEPPEESINHSQALIHKMYLTEHELEICKMFDAKWLSMDIGSKIDPTYSVDLWGEKPEEDEGYFQVDEDSKFIASVKKELFPSICPGDCICIDTALNIMGIDAQNK